MLQLFRVAIARLGAQVPFGSHDAVGRDTSSPKAAGKRGQAIVGKAHNRAGRLFHFAEARFAIGRSRTPDFYRLGAKQVAGGVDAIDTDIIERAASRSR